MEHGRTVVWMGRRAQHGVVYIEALLVLAVLVALFAAAVLVSAVYKAKLEAFDTSSSVALRDAEQGCGPPLGGSYGIAAILAKRSPSLTAPDPAYLGGAVQGPTAISTLPVGPIGGHASSLVVRSQFLCNEKPISKDKAWKALGAKAWAVHGVLDAAGF